MDGLAVAAIVLAVAELPATAALALLGSRLLGRLDRLDDRIRDLERAP